MTTQSLHDHRLPSIRAIRASLARHRGAKSLDVVSADRNTSPTDFVLRDYRTVR